MTRRLAVLLFAALLTVTGSAHPSSSPPDSSRVPRILLVSVDGLRPDVLLRARAPVLRGLMDHGCFTMWAQTTPMAVTLPSHVSMLTGVPPEKHQITWNSDRRPVSPTYPVRPTLFQLASQAGFSTAVVAGKSKFSALAAPGALRWSYIPVGRGASDEAVTDSAAGIVALHAPQVLFVHLPGVDAAGHHYGWGSEEQLQAVEVADRCVGRLLEALRERHLADSTVVFVSADHGGAGESHGPDDPRSRSIPWIVSGPGIRRNVDLTLSADLNIRTEDTFATICWLLGILPAEPVDGHPVREILAGAPGR
jgi:predicted AlkP superfamily pyrophosphatase or phosphodiesterase